MTFSFPQKILEELSSALTKDSRGRDRRIRVIGTHLRAVVASFLSSKDFMEIHRRPQVVIVADDAAAQDLETDILFFNPLAKILCLPSFDVSPYSGLYPNFRLIAERIYWLYRAQYSTGGEIFIATIEALLQKTLPKKFVDENTFTFKANDELLPNFLKKLSDLGYQNSPRVEDVGQFNIKGGIVDIYSPAYKNPIRVELFGDFVESLRFFNPETQRTLDITNELVILPVREAIYHENAMENVLKALNLRYKEIEVTKDQRESYYENLSQKKFFHGIDFFLPYFFEKLESPLDYFESPIDLYWINPLEITRQADLLAENAKKDYEVQSKDSLFIAPSGFYSSPENVKPVNGSHVVDFTSIEVHTSDENEGLEDKIFYKANAFSIKVTEPHLVLEELSQKMKAALRANQCVVISVRTQSQTERIKIILEKFEIPFVIHAEDFLDFASLSELKTPEGANPVHILPRPLSESLTMPEESFFFLREEDFFGQKDIRKPRSNKATPYAKSVILSDLNIGDLVVHSEFGVGIYDGLKTMLLNGVQNEFVQLRYEDDDKLYLPVYRINLIRKYSGVGQLDKLGTQSWKKTKVKVRNQLRDIAADLLNMYARRSQITRPAFKPVDVDYKTFEGQFAYDETPDQLQAINSILDDMGKDSPMDRLICGDVGFGKTEVAMRACFKAVQDQKQVAVLVPTVILCFQHFENFKKRFKNWPIEIQMLSRFSPPAQARETVQKLKEGKVDIVIGTHKLFSKDVQFKNLGLLIADEEHKFGVTHKEKIRKMKTSVDTIAMSATPIPRTLNMSLVGIRDLSLINTPPLDRLPIRTFICKSDEALIKKAIEAEVQRGGQVFFLHNRVQSIVEFTNQIQQLVPDIRVRYGHGQMSEAELEKTMVAFFNQEFDVLVCTTIIESGLDIPRANTILIDRADTLGLSQLYQLRGRVGRAKERAYCYLLIPQNGVLDPMAQERLKVLQENSDLGSGIRIAHHDLELRGAGNILGEEQAGHANAVGFELYLELLETAVKEARGEDTSRDELEPEINLRIPALIPDDYISDIRVRIGYYNALSQIESPDDMDRFEEDLNDQFGKVPEAVMNLMGMMLLKKYCRDLAIRDLSAGTKSVSLAFTDFTPFKPEVMIELVTGRPKKYSITPDSRLVVQMAEITWPQIYSELNYLKEHIS